MKTVKCRYCDKDLVIEHGNKKAHESCAYLAKKERSKYQYEKNQLKSNPYWKNDGILKELYYTYGEGVEIDPRILENAGFDFDIFQEEVLSKGIKVFIVDKFSFSLLKNEKIVIWKI